MHAPAADFMQFNAAPEAINGRLAMLGFVAAVGCKLFTGQSIGQQAFASFGNVLLIVMLVSAGTLAPMLRGYVKNTESFGPLTPEAEQLNGRAAMLGYAALILMGF